MSMKATAAVLSGKNEVYVKEVDLPEIGEEELLVKVVSNSVCLSTYKAALRGPEHKRVPDDVSKEHPVITGHEFGGYIVKVGEKLKDQFEVGEKFVLQPAMGLPSGYSAGYSYEYYGGNATYCIIPKVSIDLGCVLPYNSKRVVVTDINEERLERAKSLITPEDAAKNGVELIYVNTKDNDNAVDDLKKLNGGKGYDEAFVFAPVKPLIEMADHLLGNDGCLNFFAGPTDNAFSANFNFYNVHYESTHICGTSGGAPEDMLESLKLSEEGKINPSYMITHIGGINAAPDTILNLPKIPGGKKLIYPHINLELTAIEDFEELGKDNEMFVELARICKANNNVWCEEAEKYLLKTMAPEE